MNEVSFPDFPDEILRIDPPEGWTHSEIGEDRISRSQVRVSFGDGTSLTITAEVQMPPNDELTPRDAVSIDIETGVKYTVSDAGTGESMELERASTAARVFERIMLRLLNELPGPNNE